MSHFALITGESDTLQHMVALLWYLDTIQEISVA